jgi:hypothetical protein
MTRDGWRLSHDVQHHCTVCNTSKRGDCWQHWVGIVASHTICVPCAEQVTDNIDGPEAKEATMTSTAGVTPDMLAEVALALESANEDWATGRATSPDTRDFVLITEGILEQRLGAEYLWLSDDDTSLREAVATRESVAEAMYELQCEGKLSEWAEMAEWLATAVTVGHEGVA